jgi:hypothetical protein
LHTLLIITIVVEWLDSDKMLSGNPSDSLYSFQQVSQLVSALLTFNETHLLVPLPVGDCPMEYSGGID